MSRTLQVQGLSNIVLATDLIQLFQRHGTVLKASITLNPSTGLGSGSARIDMASPAEASAASSALNGAEYLGHPLKVTEEVN